MEPLFHISKFLYSGSHQRVLTLHSEGYHQPPMAASPATTPKPHEQFAPVELPGSPDPGHSPLPAYNNNNNNNNGRGFSWNGDEQGYRPTK